MNDIEIIQSYIDGTLSESERMQFEQRLATDASLMELFRTYQGIEAAMRGGKGEKETELKKSLQQLQKKHGRGRVRMFTAWRAVAAIFVLVLIGTAIWYFQRGPVDLYRKYAVHAQLDPTTRSGGNDSLAIVAAEAFNTKQYDRSARLLESYLATDSTSIEMRLALGISYLEQNRFEEARVIFNAISGGSSVFADEAKWYLALIYLKQKQYNDVRNALQAIDSGSAVYPKAQELLNNLNQK